MLRDNFIERSIIGVLSFLKESIFADEYALRKGFFQSLDPRIKAVSILLLILQVIFANKIVLVIYVYFFCLMLVILSDISLVFFLKRTWIFMPIFSLIIAIPALFNIFTPGTELFGCNIGTFRLAITYPGLMSALIFTARVITSVSLIVLLSLTTRHFELLKVLRIFRVPQVFVMIFGICYRYIYLFIGVVENTYLGIKSRVGGKLHYKRGQRIVAWNLTSLWQRSLKLNEDVYCAMLARGYNGEPVLLDRLKTKWKDWAWLSLVLITCILMAYLNYGRKNI